jgi:hypothetical protein
VPNMDGLARHSCSTCSKAFCCPSAQNSSHDCFCAHVADIRRTSQRLEKVFFAGCWQFLAALVTYKQPIFPI